MKKSTYAIITVFVLAVLVTFFINRSYAFNNKVEEKWNVYFSNFKEIKKSENVFVPENPKVESTGIQPYDVIVSGSDDYFTFSFDAVNDGNVNAIINSIIKEEPQCISLELPANKEDESQVCNNLEYKMFYTDSNEEVKLNDSLKANTKKNITVTVGLDKNSDINLVGDVQIVLFDTDFIYVEEQ